MSLLLMRIYLACWKRNEVMTWHASVNLVVLFIFFLEVLLIVILCCDNAHNAVSQCWLSLIVARPSLTALTSLTGQHRTAGNGKWHFTSRCVESSKRGCYL